MWALSKPQGPKEQCLTFTIWGIRGSSSTELHHLIPLWALQRPTWGPGVRVSMGTVCISAQIPLEDHFFAHRREPSALEGWVLAILCCDPKGSMIFQRIGEPDLIPASIPEEYEFGVS